MHVAPLQGVSTIAGGATPLYCLRCHHRQQTTNPKFRECARNLLRSKVRFRATSVLDHFQTVAHVRQRFGAARHTNQRYPIQAADGVQRAIARLATLAVVGLCAGPHYLEKLSFTQQLISIRLRVQRRLRPRLIGTRLLAKAFDP